MVRGTAATLKCLAKTGRRSQDFRKGGYASSKFIVDFERAIIVVALFG